MVAIKPQTKFFEIIAQVNQVIHAGRYLEEGTLEHRRLCKEALNLSNIQKAEGFLAMGAIAQLSGNLEKMSKAYDSAYLIADQINTNRSTAIGLINLGYFVRAREFYVSISDPKQGSFIKSWNIGIATYSFHTMLEHIKTANKMKLELGTLDQRQIERVASVMDKLGLSDDDLANYADTVGEVLRENKLFAQHEYPEIEIDEDNPDDPSLTFKYRVALPPKQAVEVYKRIIKQFALKHRGMPEGVHFAIGSK